MVSQGPAATPDGWEVASLLGARRGVRAAEGARLEIAYSSKGGSRVQIPPSPPRSFPRSRDAEYHPSWSCDIARSAAC